MNELMPFGLRPYWSGHLVTDLDPGTVSAVCGRLDETPGLDIILFEPLPGLARQVNPETAVFAHKWRGHAASQRPSRCDAVKV